MEFLTNEKLTIVGAAGMIGSNMAQTALMMKLTPNICLYDPYAPALEGVAEELYHCAFEGVNLTYTSDIKEALSGAKYIVSSGGAARKAGMTREDLLKGNAEIAAQFGKDIRQYCPDVKHVVVVFNPADITGLIVLLYAGLKPSQVSTFSISFVVSLTITISLISANLAGGILPLIAKKLKMDPASAAAPLITTIVDATSLIIYFMLAIAILKI